MKRIFLSIPFNTPDILDKISEYNYKIQRFFLEVKNEEVKLFHSYFIPYQDEKSKLNGLAESIYMMGECDYVLFVDDWLHSRGCMIEYEIAKAYHISIIIETPEYDNKFYIMGIVDDFS